VFRFRSWFLTAAMLLLAAPLVFADPPPAARSIIGQTRKIVSPNGIEELKAVDIGGIRQWLSIRGRDRRNPILLVLHGGPGSPTMPEAYTFQSPWEDYFTVVEWDQRGAGKTYGANDTKTLAASMTVEQMTHDAEDVVRYLRKTYGKQKVFVLGHSWGSVLGLRLAQEHPEWLYAYIGVGQVIDMRKSEADGYAFALAQAREHGNRQAERELLALAPYPGPAGSLTFARIGAQRKWLDYYGGLTFGRQNYSYNAHAWELSPDYTDKDLDALDAGSAFSLKHLLGPLESMDLKNVTAFRCPVVIFNGRHDYSVSHEVTAAWFATVKAPSKRLVWFENSAHMMMQEEPGRFLMHLVEDARPFAVAAGDAAPGDVVVN
jgi:pimeloyl-ACP methyl ester carboxylesterase